MAYDFAKPGRVFHGYPPNTDLGFQQIKPIALDNLTEKLKDYGPTWTYVKFISANKDQVPDEPGVYFFVVHPRAANIEYHSIILYFGKAKLSLRNRFKEYCDERCGVDDSDRDHIKKMLNIYKNRIQFAYFCLDMYEVERVEDMLIEAFAPCCNRRFLKPQPAF